uniref:Uncharacterized protein n=1 Tax=Anguilla anguilla TaxID=7936 RepID=A0A0E9WHQ5_ANGAN
MAFLNIMILGPQYKFHCPFMTRQTAEINAGCAVYKLLFVQNTLKYIKKGHGLKKHLNSDYEINDFLLTD